MSNDRPRRPEWSKTGTSVKHLYELFQYRDSRFVPFRSMELADAYMDHAEQSVRTWYHRAIHWMRRSRRAESENADLRELLKQALVAITDYREIVHGRSVPDNRLITDIRNATGG